MKNKIQHTLTLKRIAIGNYRSCLRTVIDLQPNLSVLIGPNSSGKTNILQAIMLLNKLAEGKDRHAGSSTRGAVSVRSRIGATFEHGTRESKFTSLLAVHPDESNSDVVSDTTQRWALRNGKKESKLDVPLSLPAHFEHGGGWADWEIRRHLFITRRGLSRQEWQTLTEISGYCRRIRYYGASQFTNPSTAPASFEIEQEGRDRLRAPFRLRGGHAKILFNMYTAEKQTNNRRYAQFLEIVGPRGLHLIDGLRFKAVPTSSTDYSVRVGGRIEIRKRHKLLVIPQFKIGNQKLSPNQLSEGTFKTLALLFHIITEEASLLLIEEPEVCVHHGLLSSILELIKSYSQQKQMVLSTHSDYVLDHVSPENVYRVSFDKSEGTVVRHIPSSMTSKELTALRQYLAREGNLGEYWREGGLGDGP